MLSVYSACSHESINGGTYHPKEINKILTNVIIFANDDKISDDKISAQSQSIWSNLAGKEHLGKHILISTNE